VRCQPLRRHRRERQCERRGSKQRNRAIQSMRDDHASPETGHTQPVQDNGLVRQAPSLEYQHEARCAGPGFKIFCLQALERFIQCKRDPAAKRTGQGRTRLFDELDVERFKQLAGRCASLGDQARLTSRRSGRAAPSVRRAARTPAISASKFPARPSLILK